VAIDGVDIASARGASLDMATGTPKQAPTGAPGVLVAVGVSVIVGVLVAVPVGVGVDVAGAPATFTTRDAVALRS
jgi:hypothetical protein